MAASNTSLDFFIEYLKINTAHPTPDYEKALKLLRARCEYYGFSWKEISYKEGKPIGISSWIGTQPELPSILLNGHTDVVPCELDHWKTDPFAAHKDEKGNIYARGTQDMKCVTIQHIEALGRLKQKGVQLKRTVHMTFVPDEEIGGHFGMKLFVKEEEFRKLNVGLALDEGLANPDDAYTVFYGERAPWWVRVKSMGPVGHGSRFIKNTAVEKLMRSIQHFLKFREEQENILNESQHECGKKTLGDVTTLNLTSLKSGDSRSPNVIPATAEAVFDIRIPPHVNLEEFKKTLEQWTSEDDVSFEFLQYTPENKSTPIESDSYWWKCFKNNLQDTQGKKLDVEIFPAATDSRFLRAENIPAFGFSPMRNTPILLHDHNEFLNQDIFLEGIDVFENLITDLANYV